MRSVCSYIRLEHPTRDREVRRLVHRAGVARLALVSLDLKRVECRLCLLHQWTECGIAVAPKLDEARVVLDCALPVAPSLVDLGQPKIGGASIKKIVDEVPIPRDGFVVTSERVQQLGPREPLVQANEEWRVPGVP